MLIWEWLNREVGAHHLLSEVIVSQYNAMHIYLGVSSIG